MQVIPLSQLEYVDRGWTRGHAHIAFDDVPRDALGFLDLPPVKLAVLERMDPLKGYERHSHKDVESVFIPLSGTVHHEDSNGLREEFDRDHVAVMSAGSGIEHAEFSGPEGVRAVMFWLRPSSLGGAPLMTIKRAPRAERHNRLVCLAGGDAIPLKQDASVWSAVLDEGARVTHDTRGCAYVLSTDAAVTIDGVRVEAGERVIARGPLHIAAIAATEVIVLDLHQQG
jgi:quercetin 2,3-dioxygenase